MLKNGSLQRIKHLEIGSEDHCGLNITEFSVESDPPPPTDLLEEFIRSEHYLIESRPDCISTDKENKRNFLRILFKVEEVRDGDFKSFDSTQLSKYLSDYAPNFLEDKASSFGKLVRSFYETYPLSSTLDYRVLEKDWFPTGDSDEAETDYRLRWPESWIYGFFILMIWFDPIQHRLVVAEWFSD